MIEIENVSLRLQEADILHDISLQLPKGELTALIGPNGAGKSSLMSLMTRLQPLQTGRILIDGLPVDTTPSARLARLIAILRQDNSVASRLRVEELVGFGRFPHSRGRLTADDRAIIKTSLDTFDLGDLAHRFVDTLSGGQRQRALVAMTYCQGTDYLMLDEPLNNLDMYYARDLMQTLRKLVDAGKRTVLVVLHDINHAAAYADRIVAMRDGRVAAIGTPDEIITPDKLERVFGFRMHVETVDGQRIVLHHR